MSVTPKPLQWWRKTNLIWWQDKIWAETWLASCCSSTSHYNNINFCVAYLHTIYCKRHISFPKQFIYRFYSYVLLTLIHFAVYPKQSLWQLHIRCDYMYQAGSETPYTGFSSFTADTSPLSCISHTNSHWTTCTKLALIQHIAN